MIKAFATKLDYEIPEELQKYIVGIIEGESDSVLDESYPVFAIGCPLIIYVYRSIPLISVNGSEVTPSSRLQIAGQIHEADVSIKLKGQFGQIGLLLHPLAPYYLFHKSGDYFLNKWSDFQEALPIKTNDLYSNLSNSKTTVDRVTTLFEFMKLLLETKLPEIKLLESTLTKIYSSGGNISQEELSGQVNVSLRHFRRKFKEVIGISPKYFCKIIQLNTVFELLHSSNKERLHLLALDCGYFDQAHFIKDFKRMIGNSPRKFLQGDYSFVKEYMGKKTL